MSDSGLPHVKSWNFRGCTSVPNGSYPSWCLPGCSLVPNRGDGYKFDKVEHGKYVHDGCFKLGKGFWGMQQENGLTDIKGTVCCWHPLFTPVNCNLPTLLLLGGCCLLDMSCLTGWLTLTVIYSEAASATCYTGTATCYTCCNWSCVAFSAGMLGSTVSAVADIAVSAATGAGVTAIPCVPIAASMFLYHNCCDMKHSFPVTLIKGCASGCFAVGVNGCTYVFHRGAPKQTSPVVPVEPRVVQGDQPSNNAVISSQPRSSEVKVIRNVASDDGVVRTQPAAGNKAVNSQPKTNNNNLHNAKSDDHSNTQEMLAGIVSLPQAASINVNEFNAGAADIDKVTKNLESVQL